ncbi:hypothetical protein B6D60_02195 [candidate division KSB1 bacterium 4484_87]|nr:MAG: hypothetical protein B6D60_02195 [candidate division KSB1 bacterium 4484_87]
MSRKIMLFLLFLFVLPGFLGRGAFSQSANPTVKDSTQRKLLELEKTIQELKAKIEKKEQENELKKLMEEASHLTTVKKKEVIGIGKRFHTGVRQQSALNPNISVSGDFFASVSSSKSEFINKPSEVSYGNNGFYLRELQLSLIAPLDPFTRGKTFISFTKDKIEVEEAYMEWLNLPLSMNLKIGLFKPEFGGLNRWHDHALPQFDRPKPLVNLFGHCGVEGFGVNGNFLLPRLLGADATTFDAAIIRGGNGFSFTKYGKYDLLFAGHFKNYYDVSRSTYFEFTLSGVTGKNDPLEKHSSYVGDLGLTLKWVPVGKSKYRTFEWRTELLYSKKETAGGDIESKGFFTSLQNKLNARWWISGRFDYSELPFNNSQKEWAATISLDFWQSEFVFYRLQYQYSNRDFTDAYGHIGSFPDESTLTFHVNWAMGPDKHEKY